MAQATLTRVVLLVRDVRAAAAFYTKGLGLRAESMADTHARLRAADGVELNVARAQRCVHAPTAPYPAACADPPTRSEAQLGTAYSPLLTFNVDDLDATLPRLLELGAALDGPVVRELYGATAAVRAPDGTMIGLHEPAGLPADGDTAVAAAKVARARLRDAAANDKGSTRPD